jgi:hypothetical protein
MDLFELIDEVTEITDNYVAQMWQVPAKQLGLDHRCGKLFANADCIAVYKANDRALQYYGGFEYVDTEFRHEMGEFVFYSAEDDRVQGHLQDYLNKVEAE